jgi:zinc-ribbon domain
VYCVHCGAENPTNATFCQKCGKRLPATDQDEPTILTVPSTPSMSYDNTPYSNTPSTSSETVFAPPPPPSHIPPSGEISSPASYPPAQRPKRRRGFILSLMIIVLVVIIAVGAFVYVNRSTPDKTITTYYVALVHGDYQTAYDQLSTTLRGKLTEPAFVQFWQSRGGVKAWSTNTSQEQGSTASATLNLTLGNGQTTPASISLIDENGTWKIENEIVG